MLRCLWRGGYGKNPQKRQRPVDAALYSYLIKEYNASQGPQTRLNPGWAVKFAKYTHSQ